MSSLERAIEYLSGMECPRCSNSNLVAILDFRDNGSIDTATVCCRSCRAMAPVKLGFVVYPPGVEEPVQLPAATTIEQPSETDNPLWEPISSDEVIDVHEWWGAHEYATFMDLVEPKQEEMGRD